jgi:hypothetical protein
MTDSTDRYQRMMAMLYAAVPLPQSPPVVSDGGLEISGLYFSADEICQRCPHCCKDGKPHEQA